MIPLNRVKPNGKVDLWDLGPQVAPKPPEAPQAPAEPDASKLKGPALAIAQADYAAAQVDYEDALEPYKDALRAYSAAKKAHQAWKREKDGPVKVELWGVDAQHALDTEPDRYKLDLPKTVKPGKAQVEAEARAAADADALKRARSQDPMHAGAAV